jgi:hypothetical protein
MVNVALLDAFVRFSSTVYENAVPAWFTSALNHVVLEVIVHVQFDLTFMVPDVEEPLKVIDVLSGVAYGVAAGWETVIGAE